MNDFTALFLEVTSFHTEIASISVGFINLDVEHAQLSLERSFNTEGLIFHLK